MDSTKTTKIKTGSLVLMIFSAIFGFSNSLTAYYQMGYASIIWYVITAIAFFLPSALIFAEYGAAFKGVKGGIFSWLEASTNEKNRFRWDFHLAGCLGCLTGFINAIFLGFSFHRCLWQRHDAKLAFLRLISNAFVGSFRSGIFGRGHFLYRPRC
jgi:amino acid transporter